MSISILLYALFTSTGLIGVGHFIWSKVRGATAALSYKDDFKENIFLSLGISWLLGYYAYEGLLYILAVCQLFHPAIVTVVGLGLSLSGILHLFQEWNSKERKWPEFHQPLVPLALLGVVGFVFFWNLYPMFDVDSLCDYFVKIKHLLSNGGVSFSRYEDIRLNGAGGENMIYALGFIAKAHSTLFAQLIHGVSKVMFIVCVFGAAKAVGLGSLSLLAPILIMSEEHFIASGANQYVHINVAYTGSLFLLFFGIFVFLAHRRAEYLILALLASLFAVICKYIGLIYAFIAFVFLLTILVFQKEIRKDLFALAKSQSIISGIVVLGVIVSFVPYLSNLFLTGSPVFPGSLGPFVANHYDTAAQTLGKLWHYGITPADALKTISSFMVWPGILPLKILFPLLMVVAIAHIVFIRNPNQLFVYAIGFFVVSVIMVFIQQITFVYEMRYYRFGIGIYALCCALLLGTLVELFFGKFDRVAVLKPLACWALIILVGLYSVKYSFSVMREKRPSATQIIDFVSGKTSETEILEKFYLEEKKSYQKFLNLGLDSKETAVFLPFSWPHFLYPVKARDLSFLKTGAFESHIYFDKGLMAEKLDQLGIKYVYNRLVHENYPLAGGATYDLISECGSQAHKYSYDVKILSPACLKRAAAKKDEAEAKKRLSAAIISAESRPKYNPFQKPIYGGIPGLIW